MDSRIILRTVLIIVIAGAAISGIVDATSQRYAEQSLTRALLTFTAARTLNGVISVAQGTEVAIEPGGVGVILTPGQVLDPINDLIERFSSVMLVAASSLGLQLILLEISSWWVLTTMLVILLAVWLASIWSQELTENKYVAMTIRLALMLTFVRFAVPVVIIVTNLVFNTFLLTKHESAAAELNKSSAIIEEINAQFIEARDPDDELPQSDDQMTSEKSDDASSFLSALIDSIPDFEDIGSDVKRSIKEWRSGVADWFSSTNVSARMEQLTTSAENATRHIVNLIVIFVLQTIIFPLGFLWLFVEVLKAAATRSISALSAEKA